MPGTEPDSRVAKTYVWHEGKCFFVSTIERDSSAVYAPGRYNETMVWEYDWDKGERGKLIYQGDAPRGSLAAHQFTTNFLFQYGLPEKPETDTQ